MNSCSIFYSFLVASICILSVCNTDSTNCDKKLDLDKPDADKSTILVCPLPSGEVSWSKEGEPVVTEEKTYLVDNTNRSLTILKLGKKTIGEYKCATGSNETATLTVCVFPHVNQYDKSKNVIEGDPFQTECVAWGYPAITTEWTHENNFTGTADRLIFKNSTENINSIMRIEDMQFDDSGKYTCTAKNELGSRNATIQVNVKDKLAALWPFLGICAEVAILCVIIFFYERRRAKNLEKEVALAEETEHMAANNDAKVSDDVRHRK